MKYKKANVRIITLAFLLENFHGKFLFTKLFFLYF